ncbi:hypothetical protein H2O64_19515 [Kordia sp. YSTF-M3]|uniref:Prolyl 4-hydroxylase alpha subunit Fe(2+) 2OG dioxygenase domain-containing protein n=1 Tax=Kordia aestuariivivens TaxID=2759037 RepID=A0ABR7QE84_9FLAO|nr:hypothetical protein [Kordia aestuariivivens]MBC8756871.1 hypothetical protein [Kordia aestuariivivens]
MKLIGKSYPKDNFKIFEDTHIPNLDIINDMFLGKEDSAPVYIVRNYIGHDSCEKLKNKFHEIIEKTNGGNRASDDFVEVSQIGATQFHKETRAFFDECIQTKEAVNNLVDSIYDYDDLNDFMLETSFREYLLQKDTHFGPAYHKGNYCNMFTARLWKDKKEEKFALNAHEDLAQLHFAKRDNFEISTVKHVVACNLCVENTENANLLLWNLFPDEACKKELGIELTGYPYPFSAIKDIDCLHLETQPGDLYFINANYIHAVEKKQKDSRITIGRFLGRSSQNRVVYWT